MISLTFMNHFSHHPFLACELPHFSAEPEREYAREKNANLISKKNEKIASFDVVSFTLSPRPPFRFEVARALSLLLTLGMSSSGRTEGNQFYE